MAEPVLQWFCCSPQSSTEVLSDARCIAGFVLLAPPASVLGVEDERMRTEDLTVSLGKTVDCIVSSKGGPDSTTIQSTTSASRTAWDHGSLRH